MELSDVLIFDRPVYAHTGSHVYLEKETLQEHTKRCWKYSQKLMEKGKVKEAFSSIEPALTGSPGDAYSTWFQNALTGVVLFHDAGKINPVFQTDAMGNEACADMDIPGLRDRNHSALSAYIYLDYFAGQLEAVNREYPVDIRSRVYLYEILCMNAYLIMKHHSPLGYFGEFCSALQEGGKLNDIDRQVISGSYRGIYRGKFSSFQLSQYVRILNRVEESEERSFAKYTYMRLVFSLLTACDYYAANEYISGVETTYFGSVQEIEELSALFEKTERMQNIRNFHPESALDDGEDINYLRNMLFYEAEASLAEHKEEDIFFLEAPTGCGKSNVGFHISFSLAKEGMEKIFYVYPFNNLVEQNRAEIEEMFKGQEVLKNIAVVNSVTPIKRDEGKASETDLSGEDWICFCQKVLIDRQFLNYPVILTTHVSLFETMFGTKREAVFGFHQLVGSVIVLDEIQSYKNTLWTELTMFLQYFCRYLHCKVLIMSATLPDLTLLTGKADGVRKLIRNRDFYFQDKRFRNRVNISYELLRVDFNEDMLYGHVKAQAGKKKKILIEFIQKEMAYRFFDRLEADREIEAALDRMTGDDNSVDREMILARIKGGNVGQNGYILVATQVVEAGVDIDMDIGYKDISILDSEEQFMGRINRNHKREGIVYYFNLYPAEKIYGVSDYRCSREFTLQDERMQKILCEKNFSDYYREVLRALKINRNQSAAEEGIHAFVEKEVGALHFGKVSSRMQLIEADEWRMSVFLERTIILPDGSVIDGGEVWREYKQILTHPPENYAVFRVLLSDIVSRLNLFIYQIRKSSDICYSDRIGELYCLKDGDEFFENGRLDKKKLEDRGAMFIGF